MPTSMKETLIWWHGNFVGEKKEDLEGGPFMCVFCLYGGEALTIAHKAK